MNPKDTIEIQCQVEELMSKGLVCESLGPYVVPAVVVLKKIWEHVHVYGQPCHKQDYNQV